MIKDVPPCITSRKVVKMLVTHLCPILFVTPWTVARQALLSLGFSRQEYWSGLLFPSPGDLPHPGMESTSPTLPVDSLPPNPQRSPYNQPNSHTLNTNRPKRANLFHAKHHRSAKAGTPWEEDSQAPIRPAEQERWNCLVMSALRSDGKEKG